MATNMAQKRAKKAQRRKQVVAEKRAAEALDAGLGGQVRRAARAPIQHCLLNKTLLDEGMGTLVLARGLTRYDVALGTFLLDPFCLGIKDVMFRIVDEDEFEMYVETMGAMAPFIAVEPSYARKLLRELAAWAQPIGFPPHRDFAVVEQLFGDVSADVCDAVFHFGREGKPVYIPGPGESTSLIRSRIEHLQKRFGNDGFILGPSDIDDVEDSAPSR
jgi:hypothetical protein